MGTYQQNIGVLVQTDGRYTLIEDGPRVLPRLAYSVLNHSLCLATIKLGFGWLARNNDADLCREVHGVFSVAAVDDGQLGVLEDTIVCYITLVPGYHGGRG